MPSQQEIEAKFWKALKSDMTMMLGLDGVEDGHARPMTAQIDGERGPIWFFTSKDNAIVQKCGQGRPRDRDLRLEGARHLRHDARHAQPRQRPRHDRPAVEPLCRGLVRGGKDDPKLALLRLDAEQAEIWVDASSLVAGIKLLLGADPKEEYRDKVAKVALR